MAERRHESSLAPQAKLQGTNECPRLAHLIDYALGKAHRDDQQRVEAHLKNGKCPHCRRWVEAASRLRDQPGLDARKLTANLSGLANLASPPFSSHDRTPIPENFKWQRRAFGDLEKRLQALEES